MRLRQFLRVKFWCHFSKNGSRTHYKKKLQVKGVDFSFFITGLEISLSSFTRTTANQIIFVRKQDGKFQRNEQKRTDEQLNAVVETLTIQTVRKQKLTFTDISIKVNLFTKTLSLIDGPGFISEARIRLMRALKQKN